MLSNFSQWSRRSRTAHVMSLTEMGALIRRIYLVEVFLAGAGFSRQRGFDAPIERQTGLCKEWCFKMTVYALGNQGKT